MRFRPCGGSLRVRRKPAERRRGSTISVLNGSGAAVITGRPRITRRRPVTASRSPMSGRRGIPGTMGDCFAIAGVILRGRWMRRNSIWMIRAKVRGAEEYSDEARRIVRMCRDEGQADKIYLKARAAFMSGRTRGCGRPGSSGNRGFWAGSTVCRRIGRRPEGRWRITMRRLRLCRMYRAWPLRTRMLWRGWGW